MLQKQYLTNSNLLIVQDLWQIYFQILLIILLKEFIKLNANTGTIIINAKRVELNTKIVSAVLNTQTLKIFLLEYKCLCCNKNYQKKFDKNDL